MLQHELAIASNLCHIALPCVEHSIATVYSWHITYNTVKTKSEKNQLTKSPPTKLLTESKLLVSSNLLANTFARQRQHFRLLVTTENNQIKSLNNNNPPQPLPEYHPILLHFIPWNPPPSHPCIRHPRPSILSSIVSSDIEQTYHRTQTSGNHGAAEVTAGSRPLF